MGGRQSFVRATFALTGRVALGLSVTGLFGVCSCSLGDARSRATSDSTERVASERGGAPSRSQILTELRKFEAALQSSWDAARAPASESQFGDDPYRLARVSQHRLMGILRGASQVVLLDDKLRTVAQLAAPKNPSALFVDADRQLAYVAAEREPRIAIYQVNRDSLRLIAHVVLPTSRGVRDLVVPELGRAFAVDEYTSRLLELRYDAAGLFPAELLARPNGLSPGSNRHAQITELGTAHGPSRLHLRGDMLVVNALLDHRLLLYRQGSAGLEELGRVEHDGPFWSVALVGNRDQGWVVAGGVEDQPLDRSIGSFGHIDSYLYLYAWNGSSLSRRASINLSERGVVTPKALLAHSSTGADLTLLVTGYGSARALSLQWHEEHGVTRESSFALPPGTTSAVELDEGHFALANPLLDAWVELAGETYRVIPSGEPAGDPSTRLGEALFFTTLMASANSSEGALSRFSCETCHFEGSVDGRVHYTGREQVHAATKPVQGLFNNRPLFSRALDRDLSQMAHNEFRVANAGSGRDPWFALYQAEEPWLEWLQLGKSSHSPLELRQALIAFFQRFTHASAPGQVQHSHWTEGQARGARLFREHCESCHTARFQTNDAQSEQPFESWEALTLATNPALVWASERYEKTGIEPYVHVQGTRVPSLRRLHKKWPYFSDGSAKSLEQVLDRVRVTEGRVQHSAPTGAALSAADKAQLSEFLELL